MAIEVVGVVGAGLMGSGIAEVAARSGCRVVVRETDEGQVAAGRRRLDTSLGRAVERGKLDTAGRSAIEDRLTFTTDLTDLASCQLVVEAVVEREDVKLTVFRELGEVVVDGTLLATNTSSIPVTRIAVAASRPDRVIGMHFFNPAPVLPLVELIPAIQTSAETLDEARAFAVDQLGKQVVVAKDRAGFVVNALLVPYLLSAVRMVEAGVATAEDVDTGMVAGCAHPMGPLALTDLVGLDTALMAAESMYDEFKEPLYAPPALLRRMVEAGHLGRKSGKGFYDY